MGSRTFHNRAVLSPLAVAKGVPVGAEGHRVDVVGMAGEGAQQAALAGIVDFPQPHGGVLAGGGRARVHLDAGARD